MLDFELFISRGVFTRVSAFQDVDKQMNGNFIGFQSTVPAKVVILI